MKHKYSWVTLVVGGLLALFFLSEFVFTRGSREYSTDLK